MSDRVTVFNHVFQVAAVATGAGIAMGVGGIAGVGFQVEGIAGDTITFESTLDGSTWYSVEAVNRTTGAKATTATADGLFYLPIAGEDQFRCRISTWAAGTITITGKGVLNPAGMTLADIDIIGQEDVNVAQIAGVVPQMDDTDKQAVSTYSDGITISLTPAITAGAYAAGDAVGGLLTFANAARVSTSGGVIKSTVIIDDAGQDAELELWLFKATFTAMTDNNPWAPAEADLENLVCVVSTNESSEGWMAAGTPSIVDIEVARRYDLAGTSLFGQLVNPTDTPTYVATDDLTVKIGLLQD